MHLTCPMKTPPFAAFQRLAEQLLCSLRSVRLCAISGATIQYCTSATCSSPSRTRPLTGTLLPPISSPVTECGVVRAPPLDVRHSALLYGHLFLTLPFKTRRSTVNRTEAPGSVRAPAEYYTKCDVTY